VVPDEPNPGNLNGKILFAADCVGAGSGAALGGGTIPAFGRGVGVGAVWAETTDAPRSRQAPARKDLRIQSSKEPDLNRLAVAISRLTIRRA